MFCTFLYVLHIPMFVLHIPLCLHIPLRVLLIPLCSALSSVCYAHSSACSSHSSVWSAHSSMFCSFFYVLHIPLCSVHHSSMFCKFSLFRTYNNHLQQCCLPNAHVPYSIPHNVTILYLLTGLLHSFQECRIL